MREHLKLLRIKHYIKNLIIFLPVIFGGKISDKATLIQAFLGFACFCVMSSAIYILNDYMDIENDRKHPVKKNRPLASGKVSKTFAVIMFIVLFLMTGALSFAIGSIYGALFLLLYLLLNIAYSLKLKQIPILDIAILASGFAIRVMYGGAITDIEISKYLFLVVVTGSLYLGLGKRRNELRANTDTREVLKHYNESFLDKNMYVCSALTQVFFTLWTIDLDNKRIVWTVPVFIVIMMRYSYCIEGESDGDPVEVFLKDKLLMLLIVGYALILFLLLFCF